MHLRDALVKNCLFHALRSYYHSFAIFVFSADISEHGCTRKRLVNSDKKLSIFYRKNKKSDKNLEASIDRLARTHRGISYFWVYKTSRHDNFSG